MRICFSIFYIPTASPSFGEVKGPEKELWSYSEVLLINIRFKMSPSLWDKFAIPTFQSLVPGSYAEHSQLS